MSFPKSLLPAALLVAAIFSFFPPPPAAAQTLSPGQIAIHFFYQDGCPHCEDERAFLDGLLKEYPDLVVYSSEITRDNNNEFFQEIIEKSGANFSGVPFTVISSNYFNGFSDSVGAELSQLVKRYHNNPASFTDTIGNFISGDRSLPLILRPAATGSVCDIGTLEPCSEGELGVITLPFFGDVNLKETSLFAFTVIVGSLDGFNPCAMWVLIFLIGLLFGLQNRRRMWILGFTFIAASAAVYFLFMAAWLNLILFIGFVFWVRLIIAVIALIAGIINLRAWWRSRPGVCDVTEGNSQQKFFRRLRPFISGPRFLLALLGVILLAASVNLIELVCSAGLPAIYTGVLALSNLSPWQYYAYLLLYLFFFMLDDFIVFTVAMFTLKISGLGSRYSHLSHLLGGAVMLLLGLLLLLRPDWVMFNF